MKIEGLTWPLVASVAVHLAALFVPLGAHWVPLKSVQAPALEVVLLNARKPTSLKEKSTPAQALAQASWAGGGDAERGRATSMSNQSTANTPPSPSQAMQEQLGRLAQEQQALLGQLKRQAAQSPAAVQKALAAIERRIQDENARPRTRFLGPSTREVVYAEYYDRLRHQIEALGTRQFPTRQGKPLYGSLTLILTVDARGRVVAVELVQSSGQPDLDRSARAIANGAAPYGEFSDDMRREADQLAWVIRFTFSAESGLTTRSFDPSARP
jgi:protein TonB